MGESVAEATVIRWTKSPGDYIEADETVMEIATDKVDSDVPSPVSGKLVEKLCNENDVVQVGAVIAVIETGEPEEMPPLPSAHEVSPPAEPPAAEKPAPVPEPPAPPVVPALAVTEEKTFEEPSKPVFEEQRTENVPPVPYIEQIVQKSTDKPEESARAAARFYSPLVRNIAAQEGISAEELDAIPGSGADGRLTKDDLLQYIENKYKSPLQPSAARPEPQAEKAPVAGAQPAAAVHQPEAAAPVKTPGQPQPEVKTEAARQTPPEEAPKPEPEKTPEPIKPSPTAANASVISGISLSPGDEIIEMDRMRRLIADHMVMSKQTSAHVTSFVEADVTNMVLWRDKIKSAFEKREGEKITFTPLFIESVVRAIKDMPMINISVNGTQIIKKKDINIGMATALPNGNLIVPVIKKADELSLIGLTKSVNDLAGRARNNKLKPDDIKDGTFTLTNVGGFGNVMGTPIINQPQVAILAVGAIRKKPAVIETLQGDVIGIRHMMFLSLSYDHRVVDGALGGSFVRRVADYLENWDPGREI